MAFVVWISKLMTDVIVECRGGVVQQVTVVGHPARVFVVDWDDPVEHGEQKPIIPWMTQRRVDSLATETRALYEQTLGVE